MVNGIYNQGLTKKRIDNSSVAFICFYKLTSYSYKAIFIFYCLSAYLILISNTCNREKCYPTKFIFLKIFYQLLCCFLRVCNNILYSSAKCSFYSCFIFLIYRYKISYHSMYAINSIPRLHYLFDTIAVAVISFSYIF